MWNGNHRNIKCVCVYESLKLARGLVHQVHNYTSTTELQCKWLCKSESMYVCVCVSQHTCRCVLDWFFSRHPCALMDKGPRVAQFVHNNIIVCAFVSLYSSYFICVGIFNTYTFILFLSLIDGHLGIYLLNVGWCSTLETTHEIVYRMLRLSIYVSH